MTEHVYEKGCGAATLEGATSADVIKIDIQNVSSDYSRNGEDLVITLNEQDSITVKAFFSGNNLKKNHVDAIKIKTDDSLYKDVSILKDTTIKYDVNGSYSLGYDVANDGGTAIVDGYNENINLEAGKLSTVNIPDAVLSAIGGNGVIVKKQEEGGTYKYNLAYDDKEEFSSIAAGQQGNDIINGTNGTDFLAGAEGNDVIFGGVGEREGYDEGLKSHDYISGNAGDDLLVAGAQDDSEDAVEISYNNGSETQKYKVAFNNENTEIYGGEGNDTIYSGYGNDYISGGEGNDTININGGSNKIDLTDAKFGTDTIIGASSLDTLKFGMYNGQAYTGLKLSDLAFSATHGNKESDLVITAGDNKVTLKDFVSKKSDKTEDVIKVQVLKEDGKGLITVTYSTDGTIYVDNVSDF
ncbi:hypothetical protein IJ670_04230, partial [bacterium]|nr:hypothetical protein [bacterium]